MKYRQMLRDTINGDHIVGTIGEERVYLHKYKGCLYSNYGVQVDPGNPYLKKMTWRVQDAMSPIMTDILHQFIADGDSVGVNFNNCSLRQCINDFNKDALESALNRQMMVIGTSWSSYYDNIHRLFDAVIRLKPVYDHIFVFIKDDALYKDEARRTKLSADLQISQTSNLTFVFVRDGANPMGFINDIFDIKPGNRILRIYDQRVSEGLAISDIRASYFTSQQDRDDVIYFWNDDRDPKDHNIPDACEYWINLYNKCTDPHLIFAGTLGRYMPEVFSAVTPDEDIEIDTNLTFMTF